jgi:phage shock protein C
VSRNDPNDRIEPVEDRPPAPVGEPTSIPPPPPPPPADDRRLLRRTKDDRVVFGVAGGLGRYFGIDPVLVRIAFVLLALFGGSGVLLYLIGLITIPEERAGEHVGGAVQVGPAGNAATVIGVALVLMGGFALLRQVVPGIDAVLGPLLLIFIGAVVVLVATR